MPTIRTLAEIIHHKHDVDPDAAAATLRTYIEELEGRDNRQINPDNINKADASTLIARYTKDQRAGNLGQDEINTLGNHITELQRLNEQRDPLIRATLNAGARVTDVCAVTGLTRARVHQIRKGL
jgi:hypothetical protein